MKLEKYDLKGAIFRLPNDETLKFAANFMWGFMSFMFVIPPPDKWLGKEMPKEQREEIKKYLLFPYACCLWFLSEKILGVASWVLERSGGNWVLTLLISFFIIWRIKKIFKDARK